VFHFIVCIDSKSKQKRMWGERLTSIKIKKKKKKLQRLRGRGKEVVGSSLYPNKKQIINIDLKTKKNFNVSYVQTHLITYILKSIWTNLSSQPKKN